jgi:tetratricopeptide (TPR) repeat protein
MRRVVLPLLVLLVLGGSARAEDDVKALFDRGAAFFALHKFGEAAALWEQVFERRPDAAILYNAAQAHRLAGNKPRALELYQSLLSQYGERIDNRDEVTRRISELKEAIAAQQRQEALRRQKERLQETSPALVTPAVTPPPQRPIYRRGLFWGLTAAGVVVVAGAITVGVVLGTASPHQLPDYRF